MIKVQKINFINLLKYSMFLKSDWIRDWSKNVYFLLFLYKFLTISLRILFYEISIASLLIQVSLSTGRRHVRTRVLSFHHGRRFFETVDDGEADANWIYFTDMAAVSLLPSGRWCFQVYYMMYALIRKLYNYFKNKKFYKARDITAVSPVQVLLQFKGLIDIALFLLFNFITFYSCHKLISKKYCH